MTRRRGWLDRVAYALVLCAIAGLASCLMLGCPGTGAAVDCTRDADGRLH